LKKETINSYKVDFLYIDNKVNFELKGELSRKNESESLTLFNPISEDSTLFYYNIKQNLFRIKGSLKINSELIDTNNYFGSYDSGRGVWPLKSGWFWANGNGVTKQGKLIGLNLGHGFNHKNSSNCTEDAFIIDGGIYKLPAMQTLLNTTNTFSFKISDQTEKINLTGNSCEIEFQIKKSKSLLRNIIIGKDSFTFHYGYFSGNCIDLNNNRYDFDHVYGIIEEKLSLW